MQIKDCIVKFLLHPQKFLVVDEGLPTPKPLALRAIFHAVEGENIHLKCPGAYPLLPVTWQFEDKTLHADLDPLLRHRSNGKRFRHNGKIGVDDELHIQKITVGDFSNYG